MTSISNATECNLSQIQQKLLKLKKDVIRLLIDDNYDGAVSGDRWDVKFQHYTLSSCTIVITEIPEKTDKKCRSIFDQYRFEIRPVDSNGIYYYGFFAWYKDIIVEQYAKNFELDKSDPEIEKKAVQEAPWNEITLVHYDGLSVDTHFSRYTANKRRDKASKTGTKRFLKQAIQSCPPAKKAKTTTESNSGSKPETQKSIAPINTASNSTLTLVDEIMNIPKLPQPSIKSNQPSISLPRPSSTPTLIKLPSILNMPRISTTSSNESKSNSSNSIDTEDKKNISEKPDLNTQTTSHASANFNEQSESFPDEANLQSPVLNANCNDKNYGDISNSDIFNPDDWVEDDSGKNAVETIVEDTYDDVFEEYEREGKICLLVFIIVYGSITCIFYT